MRFLTIGLLSIGLLLSGSGCQKQPVPEYAPVFGSRRPGIPPGDSPGGPPGGSPGASKETPRLPEYRFGVIPLSDAAKNFRLFQPLLDAINRRQTDFKVIYESARDFSGIEEKLGRLELDFAIVNPYQAVVFEKQGYRIFGKMGDDSLMRGIILVRKDSGIRSVKDLKGAAISFPSPTALAATMMNKLYLKRHGLDVDREAQPQYVATLDSSVFNVFHGLTVAGGTWPPGWKSIQEERPEIAEAVEVKWRTETLPSVAVIVKKGLPVGHERQVAHALFMLHRSREGREILKAQNIPKYEPADTETYRPVEAFLEEYKRAFGSIPPLANQRGSER